MNYFNEMQEYEQILFNKQLGKLGRSFLNKRNILPTTAKAWHLGFCPHGYVPECYKNIETKSKFWEKMWDRITIPIFNQYGEVIAISGRTVINAMPKYIHYQIPTRKNLFGIYQNKENIFNKNYCCVTEGQIDVIMAWQCGFKNVVSTFGAHFSEDQLALLARYCNRIGILFDNDNAGINGAEESLNKLKEQGDMYVRIFTPIATGEDLDNWVQKNNWDIFEPWFNKYVTNNDAIDNNEILL